MMEVHTNTERRCAGRHPLCPELALAVGQGSRLAPGRLRGEAGVTLVEVLIVVAIMALLASGVAVFALPKYKEAQISTANTSASVLRRAVMDWQRVNDESTCPSIDELIKGKHVDSASNMDDPWGMPWTFECVDDEIYVRSAGPDKKQGTQDDISMPKVRPESET